MRGKRTYGGWPGQRAEEQGTWASRTQKHSEAGYGRSVDRGVWTAKTVKRPRQQPAHPQYANYWAPLTRKRHTMPHSAQSQHTNYWAPRTQKRHQQDHRPTESSDPTQHAKGRTGDCAGPRKETTTRRNVTRGAALDEYAPSSPRGSDAEDAVFVPPPRLTPRHRPLRSGAAVEIVDCHGRRVLSSASDVTIALRKRDSPPGTLEGGLVQSIGTDGMGVCGGCGR